MTYKHLYGWIYQKALDLHLWLLKLKSHLLGIFERNWVWEVRTNLTNWSGPTSTYLIFWLSLTLWYLVSLTIWSYAMLYYLGKT